MPIFIFSFIFVFFSFAWSKIIFSCRFEIKFLPCSKNHTVTYTGMCISSHRLILHPVVFETLWEDNLRQATTRPQTLEDNSLNKTLVQVAVEHNLPISTDTLQYWSNGGYRRVTGGAVLKAEVTGGRKESSGTLQDGDRIGQHQGAVYLYIYYVYPMYIYIYKHI